MLPRAYAKAEAIIIRKMRLFRDEGCVRALNASQIERTASLVELSFELSSLNGLEQMISELWILSSKSLEETVELLAWQT
jgi:hypothetical protein